MGDRFEYQLESLLKKRLMEQDVARAEEATAHALVDTRRAEAEAIEKIIGTTEQDLREQYAHGSELDTEKQALLLTYLAYQRKQLEKKRSAVDAAVTAHEETMRHLEAARCSVKMLEKHREGRRTQFSLEWQRAEQKRVDELWLMREHHSDRESLYRVEE